MGKSVGNLSLVEKVGQMFMIGLNGYEPDENVMELIQTYKIGGFVIYENNVESAEQLKRLINNLKSNKLTPIPEVNEYLSNLNSRLSSLNGQKSNIEANLRIYNKRKKYAVTIYYFKNLRSF